MLAKTVLEFYKFDTDTDTDLPSDSESGTDSSSEEEEEEEEIIIPVVRRGGGVRTRRGGGVRTRGGSRANQKNVLLQSWKDTTHNPQIAPFTSNPGVSPTIPKDSKPMEILKEFMTDELIATIVNETNRYAQQYINREAISSYSRVNDWKAVEVAEMWNFLALTLLMGISRNPGIPDYWSNNPLFYNNTFPSTMSRNRYQLIHKFIHFADNENSDQDDRLYKIRAVVDYLIGKFQEAYNLEKEVCIDEQLLLHKGNLNFKQYIPNKRAKFGIKIFSLCDRSGYLWNSEVYVGKNKLLSKSKLSAELESSVGKSGAIVLRLIDKILGMGHHLYTDNWYTSYNLYVYLHEHYTGACGTLRTNRACLPPEFVTEKLQRGETRSRTNGNVVALRYKDKKDVYLLSTIHRTDEITSTSKRNNDGEVIEKNKIITDYNSFMGGVDKNDAMISNYSSVRKSHKWTTKVVLHFIEEAVFNAYIIHCQLNSSLTIRYVDFKLKLIAEMLSNPPTDLHHPEPRKSGRHYMEIIPVTGAKKAPMKRCAHCSGKKRKETRYRCADCYQHPPLCAVPCFREYHEA